MSVRSRLLAAVAVGIAVSGCMASAPRPMIGLNQQLERAGSNREPALSDRWLAMISGRGGRERVLLLDLARQLPVPLPNLNRPDAQPLSVAVDNAGERLAVIRQLNDRTELVLYRRSIGSLERLPMQPPGVPSQVSLRADGRELAVQVSRDGLWQVDLIRLP
ncbi:MAG: hypothetical protein VKK98_07695 [Cyanobacteriota bacterium]|nr:hypothetical protein [Cyanobacteriota bacterium]